MDTSKLCVNHNQPIILQDPNQINVYYCLICLQQKTGFLSPEIFQQQLQKIIEDANFDNTTNTQQLNKILYSVLNLKKYIIQNLDHIIQQIIDQVQIIESKMSEYQYIIKNQNNQQFSLESLKNDTNLLKINNKSVQNQIKQQLQVFKKKINENDVFKNLLNDNEQVQIVYEAATLSGDVAEQILQDTLKSNNLQQDESNNQKLEQKQYQYELIENSSKQHNLLCRDFAFNRDNNMLLVACEKEIIVYEFINGKITKELQRLNEHSNNVNHLYSMKLSDSLLSCGWDKNIIIWKMQNNVWIKNFILQEHEQTVICLLMNRVEDMIISAGGDKIIKFWMKNQENWSCSQSIKTNQIQSDISLNEEETKLITCGYTQKFILIFEKRTDLKWHLIQIIIFNEQVYRLSFTLRNCFVCQTLSQDYLGVFDLNSSNKLFEKIKTVEVQSQKNCHSLFPSQFIKEQNILAVKYGEQLNLFTVYDGHTIKLQQTIQFQTVIIFGNITNDGKYLVTWDDKTKQIQVRQLKYTT